MLLAEIDPSLVEYTYAHLTGIVPCMIVVLILIGCAFRHHAAEMPLPWAFAGCVVLWALSHPALLQVAQSLAADNIDDLRLELYDYNNDAYSRLMRAGAGLTTAVYAWIFCCRNGPHTFRRLAVVLLLSGFLSVCVSWLTGTVGYDGYRQGILPGITFSQYYDLISSNEHPVLRHVRVEELPSWGEGIGWIIWYVALFSGTPCTRPQSLDESSR